MAKVAAIGLDEGLMLVERWMEIAKVCLVIFGLKSPGGDV